MRQSQCTDADQQPLADIERDRHFTAGQRFQHIGMISLDVGHDFFVAAACFQHREEQDEKADDHGDGTDSVGDSDAFEAADSGIKDYDQAEQCQPCDIRKACNGFKKFGCPYELGYHRCTEEGDDHQCGNIGQQIRLITAADHVDNGDSVDFARDHSDLFTENT